MRALMIGVLSLLLACRSAAGPNLGDQFTLAVGQSATIADLGLWMRFIQVAEDSRCPTQVVCVWAGDAAAVIEVAPLNGDSKEDTLHTTLEPQRIPLGPAELRLVRLDPYPATPNSIPAGAYIATLATRAVP